MTFPKSLAPDANSVAEAYLAFKQGWDSFRGTDELRAVAHRFCREFSMGGIENLRLL